MCPQHRSKTLDKIRLALAENHPCRVVSTTLVEAGVDLDFPVVYRAVASLDSIAQAAGRCNREGALHQPGQVFVFEPEAGLPPGLFRRSAQAGQSVAERHESDLLHPDAVRDYFLELYWRTGEEQLDAKGLLKIEGASSCLFPFREIERDFQFIDTPTQGLIIPYDDTARELVRRLDDLAPDQRAAGLMRKLQRHTVSLYERDFARLEQAGAVRRMGQGGQFFVLCNMGLYDELVGLDLHKAAPGVQAPEDLVC
jgi:CRISPR-associated endonuclease/helicase Cas3